MAFRVRKGKTNEQDPVPAVRRVPSSGGYADPYVAPSPRWRDGDGRTDRVEGTLVLDLAETEVRRTDVAGALIERLAEETFATCVSPAPRADERQALMPADGEGSSLDVRKSPAMSDER